MGCRRSVIMLDLINTLPVESITEEQAQELIAAMSEQKEKAEVLRAFFKGIFIFINKFI